MIYLPQDLSEQHRNKSKNQGNPTKNPNEPLLRTVGLNASDCGWISPKGISDLSIREQIHGMVTDLSKDYRKNRGVPIEGKCVIIRSVVNKWPRDTIDRDTIRWLAEQEVELSCAYVFNREEDSDFENSTDDDTDYDLSINIFSSTKSLKEIDELIGLPHSYGSGNIGDFLGIGKNRKAAEMTSWKYALTPAVEDDKKSITKICKEFVEILSSSRLKEAIGYKDLSLDVLVGVFSSLNQFTVVVPSLLVSYAKSMNSAICIGAYGPI